MKKKRRTIELAQQTAEMFARCVAVLKPPPELTLSQWADTYRMLSAENSATPGRWHTDNAPYQREIMDAIGDQHVRKVVVMSAAQIGKTAMLMNMLGYYMSKFVNLEQIKVLANKVKSEDAALGTKLETVTTKVDNLVAAGGEANILEGVKVNGAALAISDKMVDILIASGEENGTISVNGAAVAIKGLAALAYKSEITEDELGEALKASIAAKATKADLDALTVRVGDIEKAGYQTAEQVQAAIAASGHAHFEVAETDPTAEGFKAQANVMYLYMNSKTKHYDIYAKVGESVVLLDDTTVDLSEYAKTADVTSAISTAIAALNIDQ